MPTAAMSASIASPTAASTLPAAAPAAAKPSAVPAGRVLVVDDDPALLRTLCRLLRRAGFDIASAADGAAALALAASGDFDAVVSDVSMPNVDGLGLLRGLHQHDRGLPVLLLTGHPTIDHAVGAVDGGATRYLAKPVDGRDLTRAVADAVQARRVARERERLLTRLQQSAKTTADAPDLGERFWRALDTFTMAYQPIVRLSDHTVYSYEALLRPQEPTLRSPPDMIAAASRLGRLPELGRAVRAHVAKTLAAHPDVLTFVNLHPEDLLDEDLFASAAPLSACAGRVVLEITERAALESIPGVGAAVAALRRMGYRIAVDDLGEGYSGLASVMHLEPEVVKLDMSLVRGVDARPTQRRLVEAMTRFCNESGILVVAEGVETAAERDVLVAAGCDLFQGYLFARPGPPLPEVRW